MSKKISRTEAIGLITAAIGTVYNECFQEQKSELCAEVRKAKNLGDALRAKEKRSHKIINEIAKVNSQIADISEEAAEVLEIFDEMVTNSEYDASQLMDDLKNYSIRVAKMERDMKSMQQSQVEEINEIREQHYMEIRDYERTIMSKDKVIAANSESKKVLTATQRELDELRISHKKLLTSYETMEKNFKSNADKLIERVKEVNKLKAELNGVKDKGESDNALRAKIAELTKANKELQDNLDETWGSLDGESNRNNELSKDNFELRMLLTGAVADHEKQQKEIAMLTEKLAKATKSASTSDTKELKKVKKMLEKMTNERDRLQCKCGSIDYARQEWKNKYEELYIQYQALFDAYEKLNRSNNGMAA